MPAPNMRAIQIPRYGGPEVLELVEVPRAEPARDEVLVQVHAASVNRPDISYRIGIYDPPPGASRLPGLDIAGRVVAIGDDVSRWRVGDAVCALTNGGGYAEYCAVPAGQCLPVPASLSMAEAAALPEVFFTAWVNILGAHQGRLEPGEHVLIQGGSSGVGIAGIQLARVLRSAKVVVTAGSSEKQAFCRSIGANAAVGYRDEQWPEQARACTEDGFDLILDGQGAPYLAAHLALLRHGGRLVLIGTHDGTVAQVNLRDLMRRRLTLTGSTLRARDPRYKAFIARELEREVWPRLADRSIRMPIARCFSVEDVVEAHRFLEAGRGLGKVVLNFGVS